MNIKTYLKSYQTTHILNVIGPLFLGVNNFDQPIVYVDGGAKARVANEGVIVGDGDSFSGEVDDLLPRNKDYSDLSYLLQNIPSHFSEIRLYGFLGGRRDHELINLGEAHLFLKRCSNSTKILFDDEVVALSSGKWDLEVEGTFSLFTFEQSDIELNGDCQYSISKDFTPLSSQGLSNVGDGGINIETGAPIFLFHNKS